MHGLKMLTAAVTTACGACAAATAPPPMQSPARSDSGAAANPAAQSESFEGEILALHNRHRAVAGVAPLQWDAALAASAKAYAPALAAAGNLVHSARASRPGQGENLWMGSAGRYSAARAAENWARERENFRPGTFPNVSKTGNWMDVNHYSQMIWPTTTRVGCAQAHAGAWDYVVCRYSPSGNRDDQRVP